MKRLESQTDHERAGDCDRGTETRAALDERAKAEGDQEKLQTAIRGDAAYGGLHDLEVSGADGEVVEIDGGDDDPDDVHQHGGYTVKESAAGYRCGHVEHENCDADRACGSGQSSPVRIHAYAPPHTEPNDDREL